MAQGEKLTDTGVISNREGTTEQLLSFIGDGHLVSWLSSALQAELTKMTLAFLIAARLHRAWVKKDMAEQFLSITKAITDVGETMSRNFTDHATRLDRLAERIDRLEKK